MHEFILKVKKKKIAVYSIYWSKYYNKTYMYLFFFLAMIA